LGIRISSADVFSLACFVPVAVPDSGKGYHELSVVSQDEALKDLPSSARRNTEGAGDDLLNIVIWPIEISQ
jgi:hypothetical protein